jgi:TatD DNase family protein
LLFHLCVIDLFSMLNWTDSHAHIYAKEFDEDRSAAIDRALEHGVQRILMPNVDEESMDRMLEAELKFPCCLPAIGLHPCSVKKDFEKILYQVENWLNQRRFWAVGEMGTDLYWDKTFWPEQQEAFRIQTEFAIRYKLPLIIHSRNSIDETLELLTPYAGQNLTGVFHCFSGNSAQLKKIMDLGFHVGIGGVATFKNGGLENVLKDVHPDKLILETDSPYLAPVPHRGKRNEPAFLDLIASRVAKILGWSLEKLSETTLNNTNRLFKAE